MSREKNFSKASKVTKSYEHRMFYFTDTRLIADSRGHYKYLITEWSLFLVSFVSFFTKNVTLSQKIMLTSKNEFFNVTKR